MSAGVTPTPPINDIGLSYSMEKFNEHVLPFLADGYIKYSTSQGEGAQIVSVDYFRRNFKRIAATELPNIGLRSYYYKSLENPELVMRIRVPSNTYTAILAPRIEFEQQLKAIGTDRQNRWSD